MNANGTVKLKRTGLQLEQDQKRQAILDEMLKLCSDCEFKQNAYTTELVYYSVSVVKGEIKVVRKTRNIYLKDDPTKLVKYGYRTEKEALNAINEVMPKALNHFKDCLQAYRELTNKMSFSVGHSYEGDTYGIYNEYDYISFKHDGFNFEFVLND